MTDESTPPQGGSESHTDDPRESTGLSTAGAQRRYSILSREEAMAQLSQLPFLLVTGVVTTSQANAIRSTLGTLISAHDRTAQQPEPAGVISPQLVTQLRQHPEMTNAIAAFLPQEMIERILRGDE